MRNKKKNQYFYLIGRKAEEYLVHFHAILLSLPRPSCESLHVLSWAIIYWEERESCVVVF